MAYVRENAPPKIAGYKVQYLHFRYLKFLVIITFLLHLPKQLPKTTKTFFATTIFQFRLFSTPSSFSIPTFLPQQKQTYLTFCSCSRRDFIFSWTEEHSNPTAYRQMVKFLIRNFTWILGIKQKIRISEKKKSGQKLYT